MRIVHSKMYREQLILFSNKRLDTTLTKMSESLELTEELIHNTYVFSSLRMQTNSFVP
jgi:hypothetical protein